MTALGSHVARHRRQPLHRRILATLRARRQRQAVEEARDDAYVVRIEAHAIPPQEKAQIALTALYSVLHHEHGGHASIPPAAVLPDVPDERWPHLAPVYDDDTHAFGFSIMEAGQ